jgi:Capsule polysaccharide biosynthesis protein
LSRFLFLTLGYVEADFYARVGRALEGLGDEVVHATYSRRAAHRLRRDGHDAVCVPDVMAETAAGALAEGAAAWAGRWGLPTFRDLYRADPAFRDRPEAWCVQQALAQASAIDAIVERRRPDVIVPEVGREACRIAAHRAGLARGIPVLFLFLTIFRDPLRLYVDRMDGPIVDPSDLRPLTPAEARAVREFGDEFLARDAPIRAYRGQAPTLGRLGALARHLVVKATTDRDNIYLRPGPWLADALREPVRAAAARRLYEEPPERPYVYFPLHVADDYKLEYLIPHLADQTAIASQVARALPDGYDLVLKEHPLSIGRNALGPLRRLRQQANVRIVAPRTSSHALIRGSSGLVVISSTVGLEALLHRKPVLTLGRPYYAGLGVTRDIDDVADLRWAVPAMLADRPDPERIDRFLHAAMRACLPGAPVLVDRSPANARTLAGSLHRAAAPSSARVAALARSAG